MKSQGKGRAPKISPLGELLLKSGEILALNFKNAAEFVHNGPPGSASVLRKHADAAFHKDRHSREFLNDPIVQLCLRKFRDIRADAVGPITGEGAEYALLFQIARHAHAYYAGIPPDRGGYRADLAPNEVRRKAIAAIARLKKLRAEGARIPLDSQDKQLTEALDWLEQAMRRRKTRDDGLRAARDRIDVFAADIQSLFKMDWAASLPILEYFSEIIGVEVSSRSLARYAYIALPPFDNFFVVVGSRNRTKKY